MCQPCFPEAPEPTHGGRMAGPQQTLEKYEQVNENVNVSERMVDDMTYIC